MFLQLPLFLLQAREWLVGLFLLQLFLSLLLILMLLLPLHLFQLRQSIKKPDVNENRKEGAKEEGSHESEENKDDVTSSTGEFDRMLDYVLRFITDNLKRNSDVQIVPNFNVKFNTAVIRCHLTGEGGIMRGLASLHRHGSATVRTEDASEGLLLEGDFELNDLSLWYRKYDLFGGFLFNSSGELLLGVSTLKMRMQIELTSTYSAELRSFTVTNMDKLSIEATNLGSFLSVWPLIKIWLYSYLQRRIQDEVSKQIEDILRDASQRIQAMPLIRIFPDGTTWEYDA